MMSSAYSADVNNGPVSPVYLPTFTWTGLYIGADFGYTLGDYTAEVNGNINNSVNFFDYDIEGFAAGAQLGYTWQKEEFIIGLEGDFGYLGAEAEEDFRDDDLAVTEFGAYGMLSGRLGLANNRSMLYLKTGLVVAQVETTVGDTDNNGAFNAQNSSTLDDVFFGYTVGGGVEHAISSNWTVKAEYLFFDFDPETSLTNDGQNTAVNHNAELHTVKVGLNYKFGNSYDPLK